MSTPYNYYRNSLDSYLHQVREYPLLENSDEYHLFDELQNAYCLLAIVCAHEKVRRLKPFKILPAQAFRQLYKAAPKLIRVIAFKEPNLKTSFNTHRPLKHTLQDALNQSNSNIDLATIGEITATLRESFPVIVFFEDCLKVIHEVSVTRYQLAKPLLSRVKQLRNQITRHNLRLVIKVVKKYNYLNLPLNDVIQEGNIGLLKAIDRFQLDRKNRFSTYAWWWIRQHVSTYLKKSSGLVRKPEQQIDKMLSILSEFQRHGKDYTNHNLKPIARKKGLSLKEAEDLVLMAQPELSLDHYSNDNFSDDRQNNPYEWLDLNEPNEQNGWISDQSLETHLKQLSPLERSIINLRYGLEDQQSRSFREIGQIIGKSTERTRQIESIALAKLRESVASIVVEELKN